MEVEILPDEVMYWPCENGLIATAPSGIALILIRIAIKTFPVAWFEYPERPEHEVFIFDSDIVQRLPPEEREGGHDIFLEVISAGGGRVRLDWNKVMKEGRTRIPQQSAEIFQSRMVGKGCTQGSRDLGFFIFNGDFMVSGLVHLRSYS